MLQLSGRIDMILCQSQLRESASASTEDNENAVITFEESDEDVTLLDEASMEETESEKGEDDGDNDLTEDEEDEDDDESEFQEEI